MINALIKLLSKHPKLLKLIPRSKLKHKLKYKLLRHKKHSCKCKQGVHP